MNIILNAIETKSQSDPQSSFKNNLLNDPFFLYLFTNYIKYIPKKTTNILNSDIESPILLDEDIEVDDVKEKYYLVKKLYKKLCLLFHPDKCGDGDKDGNVEMFIKIRMFYDYNLLIGLLSICNNNNIKLPELSNSDEKQILNEFILLFKRL